MTEGTMFQHAQYLMVGDFVKDAETAVELATTLIRRNFGEGALNRQQPLSAHDDGEYWLVEGTPHPSEVSSDFEAVHVKLKKIDASVASLYWNPPNKNRKGDPL